MPVHRPNPAEPQHALQPGDRGHRGHRANPQLDPSMLWDGDLGEEETVLYPPRFFQLV